jgi:hypothetical protein
VYVCLLYEEIELTMEDMSTHSGNKLTEEQIEQLIKRLRGVEHIEPIVTIEDSRTIQLIVCIKEDIRIDLVNHYKHGTSVSQMTTICSICRNHFSVFCSFLTYHRICNLE